MRSIAQQMHLSSIHIFVLLFCLFILSSPPSLAQTGTGWDALWSNDFTTAIEAFNKTDDAASRRGLLLAQLALDRDPEAVETLGRYLDALTGAPTDAYALDYTVRHLNLNGTTLAKMLTEGYQSLAESESLAPIDRRRYLDMQQQMALFAGDRGTVRNLAEDLNRISDWGVLGPFDNTSGSGHGKEFVRLVAFNPRETFDGKFGQPIHWFQPVLLPLDGSISPSHHFYQNDNTTSYVRTAVKIPETGQYLLSLGFEGDVEIKINGEVLHDAHQEIAGRERLHWQITLPSGWNRLSFKVSQREDGDLLAVGLSHVDGSTIKNLETAVEKNGMGVGTPLDPILLTSPLDEELHQLATATPDDPELALWDLMRARRNLSPDQLLTFCDELVDRFPEVGLIRLEVAIARRQAGSISRFDQEMTELAELAPQLAIPHIYQGYEDLKKQYHSRALERAKKVLERAPNSPSAYKLKLSAYRQELQWQDLKTAAEKAQRRFPEDAFPYLALMDWAEEMGDRKALADYREEAFKRTSPDQRSISRLLSNWNKEDYGEVRKYAEKLGELMPDNVSIWQTYVRALLAEGKPEKAAKEIPLLMKSFPQDVDLVAMQANTVLMGVGFDWDDFIARNPDLLDAARRNRYLRNDGELEKLRQQAFAAENQGRKAAAAGILMTALPADPGNFRLRDQIRNYQGKRSYREFFPDADTEVLRAKKVDPADYSGAEAIVIHALRRHFVFDGQASLHDQTLVVQIVDQDGVKEWERFAPFAGSSLNLTFLEYEVLKADGGRETGQMFRQQVMFKGLAPGDIIYLRYQIPAIVTGKLSGNIWDQHLFAFSSMPCIESIYELVTPVGMEFAHKTWNGEDYLDQGQVQPQQRKVGRDFQCMVWRYLNLPPTGDEPQAADSRLYLPWVDVSTMTEWPLIADWYFDLANGQAEPDAEITRKAESLVAGVETTDEKVDIIYRYVANEVTYESIPFYQSALIPRKASTIMRDGFGDCKDMSCLMIALCRAAGIEGMDFTLCTPNAPASPGFMPSPRFNHAIVCRTQGLNRHTWYDPTLRYSEPGQVPSYLAGVPALVADRFDGDLVVVEPETPGAYPTQTRTRIELDQAGNGRIHQTTTIRQVDRVARTRRTLIGLDGPNLERRLARSLAVEYPGVEVQAQTNAGLDPGNEMVEMDSQFKIPEMGLLESGFLAIDLPWRTELRDWSGVVVADAVRRSPVDLRSLNLCEEESLDLVLPSGYKLAAIPEGKSLQVGHCRYETQYERTPEGLRVTRVLMLSGDLVVQEQYPEFKSFLDSVRRDMQRSLHLRLS